MPPTSERDPAVEIRGLEFRYPAERAPLFDRIDLAVPSGARALLIGANGVGKSTLLRLIAGQHLLPRGMLQVLGRSPFYDAFPAAELALVDHYFPVHVDLSVQELLDHPTPGIDAGRQAELIELLGVDPAWRMNRVSEGQRRRVQLTLALRAPVRLLLLDEVTAHLDIVVRADLLAWLKRRSLQEGLTVFYATHILDGLWTDPSDPWPSHVAFLSFDSPPLFAAVSDIPELRARPLQAVCEDWIRRELRPERRRF